MKQVEIGVDPPDAVGRRILNWIYAWNAFADAPAFAGLGPGLGARMLESPRAPTAPPRRQLTPPPRHRHPPRRLSPPSGLGSARECSRASAPRRPGFASISPRLGTTARSSSTPSSSPP